MNNTLEQIEQAKVTLKANIYFDGNVTSHTLLTQDGVRKSVGIIRPGSYTFNTEEAEQMDILAGNCRVRVAGEIKWTTYAAGTMFRVPTKSSFEIAVDSGLTEYLCSFG